MYELGVQLLNYRSHYLWLPWIEKVLALVVQKLESTIPEISPCPVDKYLLGKPIECCYPLERDLNDE